MSPYPVSWTYFSKDGENKFVKIYKGRFEKASNPNENLNSISFENNQIKIQLKEGNYYVQALQIEGKRRLSDRDFINGLQDKEGWILNENI